MSKQHLIVASLATLAVCQAGDAEGVERADARRLTPARPSSRTIQRAGREAALLPHAEMAAPHPNEWDEWKSMRDVG